MGRRFWALALLAGVAGCGEKPRPYEFADAAVTSAAADLPKAPPGDWPWWRGPKSDGVSAGPAPVTRWSPTDNVLWKTPVPGRGHSSPIVRGDRVFLTTADEGNPKQSILAFDRKTGRPLWTTVAHEGGLGRKHPKNSHASATPACDGERVYAVFVNRDDLNVTATDLDGKILWQARVGTFRSEHGYGSSPVLFAKRVIINGDSLQGCYQTALDVRDGDTAWKTERRATGRHGNYATPVVAEVAGRAQLIQTGLGETLSYDPTTGQRLWVCAGPAEVTGNTAACSDTLAFVSGGFPEKEVLAIRADGRGDVSKTHVVWRSKKGVAYVPSLLYHDGRLYAVADDPGMITCFEAATGEVVWQERLPGKFTSSPVLAGGLLYATNEDGKTYVLKAGPKYELVAANTLDEAVLSTPAVCGGQIFLRTEKHLYCLGEASKAEAP